MTDLSTFVDRLNESYTTNRYVGQTQLRPHSDGRILRLTGLDHSRRLPGFAGIYKQPRHGQVITDRMLTTATTGIAYFRADNQAVVEDSINRARSLCDSGDVFGIEDAA